MSSPSVHRTPRDVILAAAPQLHLMACANPCHCGSFPSSGSARHIICFPLVHSNLPKRGRSAKDCSTLLQLLLALRIWNRPPVIRHIPLVSLHNFLHDKHRIPSMCSARRLHAHVDALSTNKSQLVAPHMPNSFGKLIGSPNEDCRRTFHHKLHHGCQTKLTCLRKKNWANSTCCSVPHETNQMAIHKTPLVQTWILVTQIYVCTYTRDIFSDILPDISSDILSDISSDILSDIFMTYVLTFFLPYLLTLFLMTYLPTYLSDILSDISFAILSDITFDMISDRSSEISFWHCFWHIFWQKEFFLTFFLTYLLTFFLLYLLAYLPTFFGTYLLTFFLAYLLTFFLTYLLTFFLTYLLTDLLRYLSDISSDISSDILSDISSDILSDKSSDMSSDILSDISFDILSDISSDISFDILSDISFDILSDISSDILSDIFLTYLLTFFLTYLLTYLSDISDISSDILSDISSVILFDKFSDTLLEVRRATLISQNRGWGPARHTDLTESRLRSGTPHWSHWIAVEVRHATLISQNRGWGPTRHTELTGSRWRLRSGAPHWTRRIAVEVRHATQDRGWGPALRHITLNPHEAHDWGTKRWRRRTRRRRRRRRRSSADIKSNNPQLTGGEQTWRKKSLGEFIWDVQAATGLRSELFWELLMFLCPSIEAETNN